MGRNGEHEGRAGAELVLAAVALLALAVPLCWADDGRVERRARADALGRQVLAHAATRPAAELRASFRLRRSANGTTRLDHRVMGPAGTPNPLMLPLALVSELVAQDLEVRLYVDAAPGAGDVAALDVLDARELRASRDPLRALLAHRARRVTARSTAAGQSSVRDASL